MNHTNRTAALAAAVITIVATSAATAQNYTLNPSFGTQWLSAGFSPDPYRVPVTAGGRLNAANVGCAGYIANAPDFRLNYQAGGYPLYVSVQSAADTTLAINAPDGQWYCNDDFNGLNPAVVFANPMSGQYDIWIGSYNPGSGLRSTLLISEIEAY